MSKQKGQRELIRSRLSHEQGTLFKQGDIRVALVYPSPYRLGMSSLGFQTIYRIINQNSPHSAERAFLPENNNTSGPLLTYESENPVGDFDIIAFSLSYELELIGLIECLRLSGLSPLASDRSSGDPLVVVGGPLTFSNPIPSAPFSDVITMGEGEGLILELLNEAKHSLHRKSSRQDLMACLSQKEGFYVPAIHGDTLLPVAKAEDDILPAYSQIITPDTELSNMHLVEAERGCHRRCTFCVMRRSTNGGMRAASVERILATIPDHAKRVGLVGAAVTDHPQLNEILDSIVSSGRGLGISSLRADRLTETNVSLLKRGGYKTLTVASDGASERLRKAMQKSIKARHLLHAAELAKKFSLRTLKLYMMVGVPDEQPEDIEELIAFCKEVAGITRTALSISPFVAKRNTPLDGTAFAGVDVVEKRLKLLRKGLRGAVDIRSTSARWAWVEYCLAQGNSEMGLAALSAHKRGADFASWRLAIAEHAPHFLDHYHRLRKTHSPLPRQQENAIPEVTPDVCINDIDPPSSSWGRPKGQ
jgi:radical SAM superfamily enzyme YgiQ (UPF0313 family)